MGGTIFLQTNLPEMRLVTIRTTTIRLPVIAVQPTSITLRSALPDDFEQQILVRHNKGLPLKLTDLMVTGGKLKVSLQEPESGILLYRIILTGPAGYQLPETGERITFKTDQPSMQQVTVPVSPNERPPRPVNIRSEIGRDTDRADSILTFAKRLLATGDQETAEEWLRRLVDRFPKSAAAEEAKTLLDDAAQ